MQWLAEEGSAYLEVQRSRFWAWAWPLEAPDIRPLMARARALQPGAHHYVVGWRWEAGREGADDAGEPSGTAGRPLLDLLQRHDARHAALVVARVFGGIKLGRPGLLRAYRDVGHAALTAARWANPVALRRVELRLDYRAYGVWLAEVGPVAHRVLDVAFQDLVIWRGLIGAADATRLRQALAGRGLYDVAWREEDAGWGVLPAGPFLQQG
jgi:putative IMPACT (imprinted ancient) family translation regulator